LRSVSIRAPREGGDSQCVIDHPVSFVSIRAPREGGDGIGDPIFRGFRCFNPRPPRRGRYPAGYRTASQIKFQSAPPAKGAMRDQGRKGSRTEFQSAPPAKGAIDKCAYELPWGEFQSAPPAKGAIGSPCLLWVDASVSIRAPREGGDTDHLHDVPSQSCFNPRPPRRGRYGMIADPNNYLGFNPRPPRRGR